MKTFKMLSVLLVALYTSTARADITATGDVYPDLPWTDSPTGYVGDSGAGALTVDNSGVLSSGQCYIGYNSDAVGTVTIDGHGSTWTNGDLYVGYSGTGTLNVINGGSVNNTSFYCSIGGWLDLPGTGMGTVTVDGAGSTLTNAGTLIIGYNGAGQLNISNGGSVSVAQETLVGCTWQILSTTGAINFWPGGGTLTTQSLLAAPSQLTGTGTINTNGLVSDIDLVFDATHGLNQTVTLNSLPGQNIPINLDMTNPNANGDLGAGWNGTGSLTIQDGVSISSAYGYLGYLPGSTGAATVTGPGSTWTISSRLTVGHFGNGTLNITNGGSVSAPGCTIGESSTGTATVDGAGSTLTVWGAGLGVGFYSNGTLMIANGGNVSSNEEACIGSTDGKMCTVTVDGAGSTWTNDGSLVVGNGGPATLNITNGGNVTNNGDCGIGACSSATVDGSDSTFTNKGCLYVGFGDSKGTLNITNGGSVSVQQATLVAKWGPSSSGAIDFGTNGGTLTTQSLFAAPSQLTGIGTINANGLVGDIDLVFDATHGLSQTITLNSLPGQNIPINLDMSNPDANGDLGAGWIGTGSLTIQDGIKVASQNGWLGYNQGSTGTATVTGPGSAWTNSGQLHIGCSGSGILNIYDGGSVSNTESFLDSGTVTVDGPGSTWTNIGIHLDQGALNVTNGGTVTNTYSSNIGEGTVTVDGQGSTWNNSGSLYFNGDSATLNITNGGSVSNTDCSIYSGTATVDGAGSTWTNSGNLYIIGTNDSGTGTLNISNGGSVSAAQAVMVGSSDQSSTGAINFGTAGGTLTAQSLFAAPSQLSGTGTINANGLVSDIDLVFDATHGLNQTITLNGPGQNIAVHLDMTNPDANGDVGAGYYGTGSLTIQDGVNVASNTGWLGYNSGSAGTATISGAGSIWTIKGNLYVGYGGTGSVTQAGGTVSLGSALYVGYGYESTGTYNLNGGTLILNSLVSGGGTAAFNFGGGTLQTNGSFGINLPMTLTRIGGNANVDTNGNNVQLCGVLSGPGGLNKLGSGTLTLSALNTYSGDTTVNDGTLEIAGGIDPSGTSLIDVQSGTAALKTVNVTKTNLDIITAESATFEVIDGAHTVGTITGSGTTQVDAGASLTATAICQDVLALAPGATVTIAAIPGGPLANAITPVPEPSTLVILGVGALGLFCHFWRRHKHRM